MTSDRADERINPELSRLSQRLTSSVPQSAGCEIAMIGKIAASDRIPVFSDEDKGNYLKDWMSMIWGRRTTTSGWTSRQ